ncbi:hypothetical protein EEB19_03650 [Gordonia sp. OPL2]|nr:hypothetical protein EEB19_03650 [Gordonia sp. OPL2]
MTDSPDALIAEQEVEQFHERVLRSARRNTPAAPPHRKTLPTHKIIRDPDTSPRRTCVHSVSAPIAQEAASGMPAGAATNAEVAGGYAQGGRD